MKTTDMLEQAGLDRRSFIGAFGTTTAGFVYCVSIPAEAAGIAAKKPPAPPPAPGGGATTVTTSAVGVWVQIGTDETVTIFCASQEMGQGVLSGMAQILAEELFVDWTKVVVQHAVPPNSGLTGGSMSTRSLYKPMRNAGANVRETLKAAAATVLKVSASQLTVNLGKITAPGGAFVTFGQVAAKAATLPLATNSPWIGTGQFIGQSLPRLDLPSKVDGSAKFGIDVVVPNMLYGAIMMCPTIGGTLSSSYVPKVPSGATAALNLGTAVAAFASNTWAAMQAVKSLSPPWIMPASPSSMDSAAIAATASSLMANGPVVAAETVGNAVSAIAGAATVFNQTYQLPYLAHACMEPLNCTASVTLNASKQVTACEIWAPTQGPGMVAGTAAAITGLPAASIIVHPMLMGGGLGRKFEQDYIAYAVTASKMLGKPVKLTWSREQDFGHDMYRPMALDNITAGLDVNGNIVGWKNRLISPSILARFGWASGGEDPQATDGATGDSGLDYAMGARLVEYGIHPAAIPVGFWRSVGQGLNKFIIESAIDELALLANMDPYLYRRKLLLANPSADARAVPVLDAVATLSNWSTPPVAGNARGIALVHGFGSMVAIVAEVTQPTAGTIKVVTISCAIDCGTVMNPNTVIAQMQGGILHGLAAALWGQVTFSNGKSNVHNFGDYRMMRMRDTPTINVTLVNTNGPIGGVGEPGVPGVAPAVANAWAKLTGSRLRSLPLFPQAAGAGGGDD